mmetsp:Transcript_113212/g.330908  ORF Transcript_113212/g.330908 Transcript_113212/m.330908 type:complete len:149 (-) Transcript_113212:279-725(-)
MWRWSIWIPGYWDVEDVRWQGPSMRRCSEEGFSALVGAWRSLLQLPFTSSASSRDNLCACLVHQWAQPHGRSPGPVHHTACQVQGPRPLLLKTRACYIGGWGAQCGEFGCIRPGFACSPRPAVVVLSRRLLCVSDSDGRPALCQSGLM